MNPQNPIPADAVNHLHAAVPATDLSALPQPSVDAQGRRRHDLYVGIHKALRAFMSHTLARVGAMDPHDHSERSATLGDLDDLLRLCVVHLEDENRFVHPAIEARQPDGVALIAAQHVDHRRAIAALSRLRTEVDAAVGAQRDRAAERLYRALALFVADNFEHMLREEIVHNALLWSAYADAELAGIEGALVASLPQDMLQLSGYWMLRAFNHGERLQFVDGIRRNAPPELLRLLMTIAGEALAPRDLRKLERGLAGQAALAALA